MSETTTADSAADQARAKTQEVAGQTRNRVRDQVDQRSTQAGEQAGSAADALRDTSQRLREQGNEPVAKGMDQVAERVDRAGRWLRESDGDRILREVEDFGRRNPLAVVAGGVALGFAASRLLKASSRRRYEENQPWTGNGRTGTPATGAAAGAPIAAPPGATPPPPSTGWRDPDVTP